MRFLGGAAWALTLALGACSTPQPGEWVWRHRDDARNSVAQFTVDSSACEIRAQQLAPRVSPTVGRRERERWVRRYSVGCLRSTGWVPYEASTREQIAQE